ncbi:metal ABC transporter permease [bacterium]|nr:metal ABC transporter permease [bacterium]
MTESVVAFLSSAASRGALPEIFEHAFMARGLVAALLVGPLMGAFGTLVVARKLAFFTQTVGNAAMTGVAIGLLLGEPLREPYFGLYGFCLAVAIVMTFLRGHTRFSSDTAIGVVLSQTLGLGVVMLVLVTKRFDIHQIEAVLFGSLVTLTPRDVDILALAFVPGLFACGFLFNRVLLAGIDPTLAAVRGHRPVLVEYVFVVLLTAAVVASLKIAGALLVLVLTVMPAAAAEHVARGLRGFFFVAVILSTISTVGGLTLSGYLAIPTGGGIVVVATVLFYSALLSKAVAGAVRRQGNDLRRHGGLT